MTGDAAMAPLPTDPSARRPAWRWTVSLRPLPHSWPDGHVTV